MYNIFIHRNTNTHSTPGSDDVTRELPADGTAKSTRDPFAETVDHVGDSSGDYGTRVRQVIRDAEESLDPKLITLIREYMKFKAPPLVYFTRLHQIARHPRSHSPSYIEEVRAAAIDSFPETKHLIHAIEDAIGIVRDAKGVAPASLSKHEDVLHKIVELMHALAMEKGDELSVEPFVADPENVLHDDIHHQAA